MDDESNNSYSPQQGPNRNGNGHHPGPSPFSRMRRPSSSIISSTTSPMFQAPPNHPNLQPPPSPLAAHLNRHRLNQSVNNNSFGSGDIDDDVQPLPNSRARASASSSSSASSSNYNNNNNRPQSPLGSPDSSTYWGSGPSPSPMAHQGYRAPLTPGGMCVVSSSTSDDIPQSPFSPEEIGGNSNSLPPTPAPQPRVAASTENRSSPPTTVDANVSNNSSNQGSTGQGGGLQPRASALPRARLAPVASASFNSHSSGASSSNQSRPHHLSLNNRQQNVNQDLNINAAASNSSTTVDISPLRNKIRKYYNSQDQGAINSNAASSSAASQSVTTEHSISPTPPKISTSNSSMSTSSSSSLAGSSRLNWDPSPPPPGPATAPAPPTVEPSSFSIASTSLRSFGGTNHMPKKLAARLIAIEQEQLNESLSAAASSASTSAGTSSFSSSIISAGPSTSSQSQGLIVSHQNQQHHTPSSTLAQILNQAPSNCNNMMNDDSILNNSIVNQENLIVGELSDSPLNLTESSSTATTSHNSLQQQQSQSLIPQRNPVISSRSSQSIPSKKMLTPKQKLLHRMQSAELMSSMSSSPPPQIHQQTQSHQQSIPVQAIQQQSTSAPVVTMHQSMPAVQIVQVQETLQTCSNNNSHMGNGNAPSHSPPQESYGSYEALLRSRDEFVGQDQLGKVVTEDPNVVSGILYDPDNYSQYYYNNILADEIFSGGNNGSNSSRPLLMMAAAGSMQDDQPHGNLEFVLGLSNPTEDHENDRAREEELQLTDGNSGSQQQFLDSNDTLSVMKSQADSTLRNLLMMEPLRNNHPDDSWLLAAAEYQNRMNTSDIILRPGGRNVSQAVTLIGGGGPSVSSVVNVSTGINNSWINEWPRTSSWQSHPSATVGSGVQDQDEVMDMSIMEQDKGNQMSNQGKRLQMQLQSGNDHSMEDLDLSNGLPILSSMPMSMPMDLQQPMSILQHGSSVKDNLPMDLQQHRMDIEDEPVNLMAVNIEQELASHHSSNQHHQSHQGHHQQQQKEGNHVQVFQSQNHHQSSNSYTLQIQSHHNMTNDMQQSMADMNNSNSNSSSDNIDERRMIRPKKKDNMNMSLISSLDDGFQTASCDQQHPIVIMDKPIQPKSIASLPTPFSLDRVAGNRLGVFTNADTTISPNTRLGPVEGPLKKAYADDINNLNAAHPCLVMADGSNVLWQLDRTDDEICNWMKFVRLARSLKEQNAVIVENGGYLYFMTRKEIPPKTELQVGYSLEYAQKYGFPYLIPVVPGEDLLIEQEKSELKIHSINDDSNPSSPMMQHEIEISNTIQMNVCNNENSNVKESNKSVIVSYPCFECEQDFSLVEDLQSHLDNMHKEPEEEIRKPKKKVLKKFNSPSNLLNSVGESSSEISNTQIVDKEQLSQNQFMSADSSMGGTENQESGLKVTSNDVGSSTAGKAQDNSVSTGGGQPLPPPKVKCTMCYKSFATKERLEKHMIVHSDEDSKPLLCQFCPKRFLTNSALAGHIKTHAEEGKCFECPMCEFSTQQLLQLKEHVQTHKNRETGFFSCPQCPKRFTAYSMIRKHIRAFHGPRQFSCDQCSMSFPTCDKLKLHKLKHSDHREFLCATCGRQFKRKDKLREHTKRIHETKKKEIELNIAKDKNCKKFTPKVAPEEYQRFLFKCQDCMIGFKRRGMLVNHLAKRHPEKSPKSIPELNQPILRPARDYICSYCPRVYKSSSKRKAHILKAHPGKEIPPQLRGAAAASEPIISGQPPTCQTGTVVQTVTDDGDPRHGIMNVSCTSNITSTNGTNIGSLGPSNSSGNNLVSTTSTPSSMLQKEVGKIVATPHNCPWCYRQYATRAKLLQHQRKIHIELMPKEMQKPRTQKNNVSKTKSSKSSQLQYEFEEAIQVDADVDVSPKIIMKGNHSPSQQTRGEASMLNADSSTAATSTTIQTMAADGLSVNESSVIGFLLTTTVSASGELASLLPSEIVLSTIPTTIPVQNLSNASGSSGINVNVLQSSQAQPISISSASPNPNNITIITSSNSNNPNGNNNN